MTNVNSGFKRTWDGAENEPHKRPRSWEEPKDWKDVHLRSPSNKGFVDRRYSHDNDSDKRMTVDRRADRRGGDSDYRRAMDHGRVRDRSRRRDDREREREKERHRSWKDESFHRDDTSMPKTARMSPKAINGQSRDDSEREEGEISPTDTPEPTQEHAAEHRLRSPQPEEKPREIELDIAPSPPPVEDILAARRARRQAILAKYVGVTGSSDEPGSSSAAQPPTTISSYSDPLSQKHDVVITVRPSGVIEQSSVDEPHCKDEIIGKRESTSASPTPRDFSLVEDGTQAKFQVGNDGGEQVSAADYDPSLDRREDERRRVWNPNHVPETVDEEVEEEEVEDMFAIATTEKKGKRVKRAVEKPVIPALITTATLDSAADSEGYYTVILGEQLDGGRYQVFSSLGKGMFANVVRARILQGEPGEIGKEVAIKIIRCQESMYKAGLKEAQILTKLRQADPEDKKHIVRLDRTFEHRGHLCLVFESLSMNLRDVVKRFGKDVGLNIRAVRAYAHQLFLALSLLKKSNIMHADIKPDNILVNEAKTLLKLCDLGSASDASENDITPYLVSRFYRAPEIILGVPYDPALDVWSVGCTLYELYTGKILFPGRTNNQMLLLMMELKSRFNGKMIKKAKFGDLYFDEMGAFQSVEKDRVTGGDVIRKVHITKPTRDLRARLMPSSSVKLKDEENKMIVSFIDLLDKCLTLDPSRRISPREALAHPFIRG
ncbi:hypothetical protein AX15_000344 [Amanita polypyramis BW_CC]|nr:hypothetical protein AX15_000344 [Amanita polypyramis BW_CC]